MNEMSSPVVLELLHAWTEWDRNPGSPAAAGRMETATWAAAQELCVKVTPLRNKIAEGRRLGYPRSEVVAMIWFEALENRNEEDA